MFRDRSPSVRGSRSGIPPATLRRTQAGGRSRAHDASPAATTSAGAGGSSNSPGSTGSAGRDLGRRPAAERDDPAQGDRGRSGHRPRDDRLPEDDGARGERPDQREIAQRGEVARPAALVGGDQQPVPQQGRQADHAGPDPLQGRRRCRRRHPDLEHERGHQADQPGDEHRHLGRLIVQRTGQQAEQRVGQRRPQWHQHRDLELRRVQPDQDHHARKADDRAQPRGAADPLAQQRTREQDHDQGGRVSQGADLGDRQQRQGEEVGRRRGEHRKPAGELRPRPPGGEQPARMPAAGDQRERQEVGHVPAEHDVDHGLLPDERLRHRVRRDEHDPGKHEDERTAAGRGQARDASRDRVGGSGHRVRQSGRMSVSCPIASNPIGAGGRSTWQRPVASSSGSSPSEA